MNVPSAQSTDLALTPSITETNREEFWDTTPHARSHHRHIPRSKSLDNLEDLITAHTSDRAIDHLVLARLAEEGFESDDSSEEPLYREPSPTRGSFVGGVFVLT